MIIQIKMGDGRTVAFNSLAELGRHYGEMGDAFDRIAEGRKPEFNHGKAATYHVISWQLSQAIVTE